MLGPSVWYRAHNEVVAIPPGQVAREAQWDKSLVRDPIAGQGGRLVWILCSGRVGGAPLSSAEAFRMTLCDGEVK